MTNNSNITNQFKKQASASGVSDLKKLKFEDEIKGGKADKLSIGDLAKKHKVSVDDIKKEIEIGVNIEKEHVGNDVNKAKEIAMDHISEFSDYYSNKRYGVLASEKGLKKDEIKRFKKKEIEEASTGESVGGSFLGPLGGKEIRRTLYKQKTPVSDAGGKLKKPIGKLYSFKKKQLKENNVFTKSEIIKEAIDATGALGQYDTSVWGDSEFMLTKPKKGEKGKVRVRKGKDYKKTPGYGIFVKVKDECKEFPYCNQSPEAIELSDTFTENIMDRIPKKEDIKNSWNKFVEVAKREGKETSMATKIIKKVLTGEETSDKEIEFLKAQSGDIVRILSIVAMGAVSSALPFVIEKMLNKKGISILPKERSSILDPKKEELVESICKKTGKSKNYVHSLINRYL